MNLQRYTSKCGRTTGDELGITMIQSGPLVLVKDLEIIMDRLDDQYGPDYQAKWQHLGLMLFDDDVELEEQS